MADVLAATATLLIAADRGGVQEATPAPKPEPLDVRPAVGVTRLERVGGGSSDP